MKANTVAKKLTVLVIPIVLFGCGEAGTLENAAIAHLPPRGFVGDAYEGKKLYAQYCMTCHGVNGLGSDQGPAFIRGIYSPRHHADLSFHWAVSRGVKQHHGDFGDMSPLPDVTPEQVEHIISFVRAVQQRAGLM